jgi:hypothetical protein
MGSTFCFQFSISWLSIQCFRHICFEAYYSSCQIYSIFLFRSRLCASVDFIVISKWSSLANFCLFPYIQMVPYHCINGLLLTLIYGSTIITTVEVIMPFWQVYKVAILKILSWFLLFWGEILVLPHLYYQRSHISSHCGIEKCPIRYGKVLDLHDLLV